MSKLLWTILLLAILTAASAQTYGAWGLYRNMDPITDENRSFVFADATEYPGYSRLAAVVIRCSSAAWHSTGVEVFFDADTYLGSKDDYPFVYRVDRREPVNGRGNASTSNEGVFFQQSAVPGFLRDLVTGSSLVFRVSAFDGPLTYTVPVNGLNDALYALGCYKGPAL